MKRRIIATMLTLSVFLCACQKKNESRESSKPDDTTTASDTSEKASETVSKPTMESETDPSSGMEERKGPYEVDPKEKIGYVEYEKTCEEVMLFHSYNEKISDGYNCISYFKGSYETVGLQEDRYPALTESLERYLAPYYDMMKSNVEQGKTEFEEDDAGRMQEEDRLLADVLRADDKVFTIRLHEEPYRNIDTICSFDTQTGAPVKLFDDVVTDKDAFIDVAVRTIQNRTDGIGGNHPSEESIRNILSKEEVPFMPDYSGVNLYFNSILEEPVRISYYGHEEILNGRYFDSIPEEYVIHLTLGEDFEWDLDGDGTTETIRIEAPRSDENEVEDILISVGDNTESFPEIVREEEGVPYLLILVHADGHDYLYMTMIGPDQIMWLEVFEMSKDAVVYKGGSAIDQVGSKEECFRPASVRCQKENYLVGVVTSSGEYMIGADGLPVPRSEEFDLDKAFCPCLRVDLPAVRIDPMTGKEEGEVMIPSGTSLEPYRSDLETYESFRVLDEDADKEIYIRLDLGGDDPYDREVNGQKADDLFMNLFRGA